MHGDAEASKKKKRGQLREGEADSKGVALERGGLRMGCVSAKSGKRKKSFRNLWGVFGKIMLM